MFSISCFFVKHNVKLCVFVFFVCCLCVFNVSLCVLCIVGMFCDALLHTVRRWAKSLKVYRSKHKAWQGADCRFVTGGGDTGGENQGGEDTGGGEGTGFQGSAAGFQDSRNQGSDFPGRWICQELRPSVKITRIVQAVTKYPVQGNLSL